MSSTTCYGIYGCCGRCGVRLVTASWGFKSGQDHGNNLQEVQVAVMAGVAVLKTLHNVETIS